MVKRGDVCTFGFLYSGGPVAGPGDGPGGVQKAKSAKNDRNHRASKALFMILSQLWVYSATEKVRYT